MTQQKQAENTSKRALLSLGHLKDSFYTCFVNRSPKERCRIALLLVMAFIVLIISSGRISLWTEIIVAIKDRSDQRYLQGSTAPCSKPPADIDLKLRFTVV